ncbi:MAG: helix-turn-helix domain-containing protein [Phycisphaerales bacterium]
MPDKAIHSEEYAALVKLLVEAREAASLTQTALAEKLGWDQSYVSKYETRERRLDVIELRMICRAIGVTLPELVNRLEASIAQAVPADAGPEVGASPETFADYPKLDKDWDATNWENLVRYLVDDGIVTWKEIGSLVLGHLNPSQVGTSMTTDSFKKQFPPRKCWAGVREWHFNQTGKCADCGTRLELQADHKIPKEQGGEDKIDNMTQRCRRCNVIRRPSHKQGGKTFLTAEAALMWILFVRRPKTYQEFATFCREYGMTMANIRFEEAWAMARWLEREGKYKIDPSSQHYKNPATDS